MARLDTELLGTLVQSEMAIAYTSYLPDESAVTRMPQSGLAKGKQVSMGVINATTVRDNTNTTATEMTTDDVDSDDPVVTINKDKYISILMQPIDEAQAMINLAKSLAKRIAGDLGAQIWNDLLALSPSQTAGATTKQVSFNDFKNARKLIADQKAPEDDPLWGVVSTTQWAQISGWSRWSQDDRGGILKTGKLPPVYGFNMKQTQETVDAQTGTLCHRHYWGLAYSAMPEIEILRDNIKYRGNRAQAYTLYGVGELIELLGVKLQSDTTIDDVGV